MITKRIDSCLNDDILGDLLEFRAIAAGSSGLDMMDIQRDIDVGDSEIDDDLIAEDFAEIMLNNLNQILQTRLDRVGEENYPFNFSNNGSRFFFNSETSNSGYIYLFCLLLSHPVDDDVLTGIYRPKIRDRERKLFQACSTVAAAGLIAGNAVSFGFPRPDGSGFYSKLKQVYSLLADGKIRDTPIPGTPTNIKDYKIDVIAWLHRRDALVLERYFLAQVASGLDWPGKPLTNDTIEEFHDFFFSDKPKKDYERGIFIPFNPEYERNISLEDKLRIYEKMYGEFHYRFSIPRYYAKGYELSRQNKSLNIDGVSNQDAIINWVRSEIQRIEELVTE
jgi:hypothetical protein